MVQISRRRFLALGGAGAAGLALEGVSLGSVRKRTERPHRTLHKFRDPMPTACTACGGACAVVAYRDGGLPVQVGPNRAAGALAGTCARAYESLEAVLDPDRVLTPLRRKGPRGGGEWEPVTWDEAVARIAGAVAEAPDRAFVDVGRPDPLAGLLLDRLGVPNRIDHEASREWAALEAQRAVYGAPLATPDLRGVRTVLLVGARPLDEGPDFVRRARALVDARRAGARVVAIGPYEGATGSLADEWIPVRPGAEALALLGIVRVLLSQGWYDRERFEAAVSPSPEEILESLVPYTVDLVEAASGLSALTLVRLAKEIRDRAPALCLVDAAGSPAAGALEAGAAVLNAVHGDPETAGVRLAHPLEGIPRLEPTLPRTRAVKDLLAGGERASLYLAYRSNPVYWSPRSRSVRRAFAQEERIGLVVVLDTHLHETAQVADLVLPAAADLELWNLLGGYDGDGRPFALLQQPVLRMPPEPAWLRSAGTPQEALFDGPKGGPRGEARQLGDVLLAVARNVGGAAADLPYPDTAAYVRHLADTLPFLAAAGGFERLRREGVWRGRIRSYPWASEQGFGTPTGRLEVAGRLVHRMPRDLRRLEGEDFALVVLRHPELDPAFPNTRWGREIRYRNPVFMNPAPARRLGLATGDRVVLETQVGEAEARVVVLQGLHPRAVAVAEDFGHWAGGRAAAPVEGPKAPWWAHHGAGVSVPALSPFASDPYGAQAWQGLRVTVRPA